MADLDLQVKGGGGGGGHPDPEISGGGGAASKNFFSALRASFWSKNKGGGRTPFLDPPLKILRRAFKGSLCRAGVCRQGLHSLKMKIDTPV